MTTTSSPIEAALEDIEAKIADAGSADSANGWRHAALVVRSFAKDPAKAAKHLRQHARHHTVANPVPDKAAAYREALTILILHTGEEVGAPGRQALPDELFALT